MYLEKYLFLLRFIRKELKKQYDTTEQELINAALKQIHKCNTNLVFANDLAELRKGNAERLVISPNGFSGVRVNGAEGIFNLIKIIKK